MNEKILPIGHTLRKHRLGHLGPMPIDDRIFQNVFAENAAYDKCDGRCCKNGVWVDPTEVESIKAQASLIQKYMEDHQPTDPEVWFDENDIKIDSDYPSGKGIGTRTNDHGCVFLMKNGWCVLHHAALSEGQHKFAIKPFFCAAHPMLIEKGSLTLSILKYFEHPGCCTPVAHPDKTPISHCSDEIVFMLGDEAIQELNEMALKG